MVYISARIHKYICSMNITKLNIIISFLLTALSASAMKYQIKVLNTPSITIDNKVAKVGDWFDDQSVIVWSKDNQAMRVVSEDNKVYTLSAKLYKESKSKKFSDFIIYTKPLAARGTNDLDLIEQLAERFDNTFVMLDEIVIDLSDIEFIEDTYVEFYFEPLNKSLKKLISRTNPQISISRNEIQYWNEYSSSLLLNVYLSNRLVDKTLISKLFEIDVLSLILAHE